MKLKTKYERMTKSEKKDVYLEYKKEKPELFKKMKRMIVLIWIGIIYSLVMFIYDLLFKSVLAYVLDIILLLFCIFALIKMLSTKKDLLNKFVLEKDKIKKKKS